MTLPNCTEHGNLVLELARGLLDDQEAMRAEQARVGCGHCARWWNRTFGDQAIAVLDTAVDEVFSSWTPPARRRRTWLAAAAAVMFAVGLGTTSLMRHDSQGDARTASTAGDVVSVMDFEESSGAENIVVGDVTQEVVDQADGEAAVFVSGLESGDLSGWSSHS